MNLELYSRVNCTAVADPEEFQRKVHFEIDFNPGSLSALIEQSDRDSLIEQSD